MRLGIKTLRVDAILVTVHFCSWCVVGCVCIDLWRASCVEDAMCYTITICIRLTPSRSVRSEACDEGMSNIHVFVVSLLVMGRIRAAAASRDAPALRSCRRFGLDDGRLLIGPL